MSTIPELFHTSVARFGTRIAIIEPIDEAAFSILSYQELQQRVHSFAGYLQEMHANKRDRLMLWSESRADWLVAYLGALFVGMIVVPLDVNSKEDFLQRVVAESEVKFLVTTQKQYKSLQDRSIPLIDIDALPVGTLNREELSGINEDELAQIVYTSGTTGHPKGVMLSHKNIVSNAIAAEDVVKSTSDDRALSILPLSHMFELTIDIALIYIGASIIYARTRAPDVLLRLLSSQQATCMVLVPQVLKFMLDGIEHEVRRTHREKQWKLLHIIAHRLPFRFRHLLFRPVHQRFGGRFRFFICGGGYLSPALAQKWENMGIIVLQGYGTTECAPIVTATPFNVRNLESVGKPLPGVDVKIAEDNEILVHGPNVSAGYWKNPEATGASFRDGWHYTGDLGYFDENGWLYLKGRKKNLIVLANGMKVYPEDVENVLCSIPGVKDAVVIGKAVGDQNIEVHSVLLLEDGVSPDEVVQQANKKLARHQHIRSFSVWQGKDFPRTHTLKARRQEVIGALS